MDRNKFGYVSAVVIGAGTAFFFIWWFWNRHPKHRMPSKWRKIGELSDLICFPVKSLGAIRLNSMECTQIGLRSGWLRDRILMVIDLNGKFVTGRQIPKMVQTRDLSHRGENGPTVVRLHKGSNLTLCTKRLSGIQSRYFLEIARVWPISPWDINLVQISPSMEESFLTLKAPGMMSVSVDLSQLRGSFRASVWGQAVPASDCGEEIARWLSRFLLQEDTGLRLVYYPMDKPARDVRTKSKVFPLTDSTHTGAYPDNTSYTLQNEASITDLNSKLDVPVTPMHFRPNFLVKGAEPLEEDNWDWIKIGQVIFRNIKPCTRCIFTTVDPETGVKSPLVEPLKTLRKYRTITDPKLRPYTLDNPVMGIHLGLYSSSGVVQLGDPVYVNEEDSIQMILKSPS